MHFEKHGAVNAADRMLMNFFFYLSNNYTRQLKRNKFHFWVISFAPFFFQPMMLERKRNFAIKFIRIYSRYYRWILVIDFHLTLKFFFITKRKRENLLLTTVDIKFLQLKKKEANWLETYMNKSSEITEYFLMLIWNLRKK